MCIRDSPDTISNAISVEFIAKNICLGIVFLCILLKHRCAGKAKEDGIGECFLAVSYTHLDVYKRQELLFSCLLQTTFRFLHRKGRFPCRISSPCNEEMCIRDRGTVRGAGHALLHKIAAHGAFFLSDRRLTRPGWRRSRLPKADR